ncbi:MAG: SRPBCC family protein [Bacteroidales bacterium]
MKTTKGPIITVGTTVHAPVEKVWELWIGPEHIRQWNNANADWHTPSAENDLQLGGRFVYRMESRDGAHGFEFSGEYTRINPLKKIEYNLDDGRKVTVNFHGNGNETTISESFEAEQMNPADLQQEGWQAILDNFKNYVESHRETEKLHFDFRINAPVEKVYKTMLDEQHFAEWTAVFNPSSHFKGSWEKGAKIYFIGIDEDGTMGGMVSRIRENVPNKFVSIEHIGILKNGKEVLDGKDVEPWAGSLENYTFTDVDGGTLLTVEMDSIDEFNNFFLETWPKALKVLKEICEKR